ncbi:MAG TPA: multidrug efflux SMR transporter [Bacteroidia bacterium]|nr:multidrug efflux SMR transporter [Bacteroidia bacterium]
MQWLYLAIGIIFEVLGTVCMKKAEGFTKLTPSVLVFVFYALALACLVMVLKKMGEISVVYAIWAGAGTAFIAIIGMIWLKEPVTTMKVASILLIVTGIVGLELS